MNMSDPIERVKQAKARLEAAQTEYETALQLLQARLGDGFVVKPAEDEKPPALERGDVIECITDSSPWITRGSKYVVLRYDEEAGEVLVTDDTDDDICFPEGYFKRA